MANNQDAAAIALRYGQSTDNFTTASANTLEAVLQAHCNEGIKIMSKTIGQKTKRGYSSELAQSLDTYPIKTSSSITIVTFTNKDYALTITVEWRSNSAVLYNKTVSYCFSTYAKIYNVKLSKAQVSSPSLLDRDNWLSTKCNLNTYIDAADNAVALGAGITIAQLSLNKAKFIIDNPKLVF